MRYIFIFFLLLSISGYAQTMPNEVWHPGRAILTSGEVITGRIKYDLEANLIQVQLASGQLLSFPSQKVDFFDIEGAVLRIRRQFYSLPFDFNGDGYAPSIFFEVLLEDSVSLLCREYVVTQNVGIYTARTVKILEFRYYLLDQKQGILYFTGGKRQFFNLIDRRYVSDIKQFMKKNRLRTNERQDLRLIVEEYNRLLSEGG